MAALSRLWNQSPWLRVAVYLLAGWLAVATYRAQELVFIYQSF